MPTALITGGSRGLGRALALELAVRGWKVTITGRQLSALEAVAAESSGEIRTVVGNIRDESHRVELAELFNGSLDLLVNNASHLGPSPLEPIAAVGETELHAVFDTNVVSPLALTAHLLSSLRAGDGVVVNISSDAAVEAYETWGPYGASKAGLDHATAILAKEEPTLRVYSFDPGDMRTEMHQAAFPGEDISDRPRPETVVPGLTRLIESRLPSGRYSVNDMVEEMAR